MEGGKGFERHYNFLIAGMNDELGDIFWRKEVDWKIHLVKWGALAHTIVE